jgi:hypothetical protein
MANLIKKIKKRKQVDLKPERKIYIDWGRAVVLFFVVIFAGAGAGAYGFIRADNIESSGEDGSVEETVTAVDEDLLSKTIEFYTEKEERFKNLKSNYRGAPSI